MLPVPDVARRAAALAREHGARHRVVRRRRPAGAARPGACARAGVERVVASTHGHEVGWSMLPGRAAGAAPDRPRRRRRSPSSPATPADRVAAAFGPGAALEPCRPASTPTLFRPDPAARAELRRRYRLGDAPVVTLRVPAGAAQGPGHADPGAAADPRAGAGDAAAAGRRRPGRAPAAPAGRRAAASPSTWCSPARCRPTELPAHHAVGDVFALPCRTRGGGLDVEGLGIVLLEAAACGLPVVAGDSGGAPETVRDGETGHVVDGRDLRRAGRRAGRPARRPGPRARDGRGRPARGCGGTGPGRPRGPARWPTGCAGSAGPPTGRDDADRRSATARRRRRCAAMSSA